jgi:hypothetical protein
MLENTNPPPPTQEIYRLKLLKKKHERSLEKGENGKKNEER